MSLINTVKREKKTGSHQFIGRRSKKKETIDEHTELIKVAAPPFGAERLFESDEDAGDAFAIPRRAKEAIAEPFFRTQVDLVIMGHKY